MAGAGGDASPVVSLPWVSRPAAQGHTHWRLTYEGTRYAATPPAQRDEGMPLAVSLALGEDLEAANEAGFVGFRGPQLAADSPLQDAASRTLSSKGEASMTDLSTSESAQASLRAGGRP